MTVYNFSAGPATLPKSVLQKIQNEFLNYDNTGMSVIEMSHRGKQVDHILNECKRKIAYHFDLANAKYEYDVLFMHGGASVHFFMAPMNLLNDGDKADYVDTGIWTKKSIKEAKRFGDIQVIASSEDKNYNYIPKIENLSRDAKYLYLCSNNTIFGTQYHTFPKPVEGSFLIGDFSSDILSRKIDVNDFGLIFAGAQKNLGPSGLGIAIIRKDILEKCKDDLPSMCSYKVIQKADSVFNTCPVFPIYVMNYVMDWISECGGIEKVEEINNKKAKMIYDILDEQSVYTPVAEKESRSAMNITLTLPNDEMTTKFLKEAEENYFLGLKGHRSVGGLRASIYNSFPVEGVEKFCKFLKKFAKEN